MLPERLDAEYVGEDGARHRPVMLHRAILGTFERFIGILIENYAGRFPLWLAPRQVVVAPIVSEADDYAEEVVAALRAAGLRAEADLRNEKINYKVREHSLAKVPVILAVGHREVEDRTVSLRRLGETGSRVARPRRRGRRARRRGDPARPARLTARAADEADRARVPGSLESGAPWRAARSGRPERKRRPRGWAEPSARDRCAPAWRVRRRRACRGQAGAHRFVDGRIGGANAETARGKSNPEAIDQ